AGEFERTFETQVAGVRMRAPMMQIHTVAAGGGSICHFDGTRYRVGPDSAGADPGPACYRRGGPLTVTDCNVMLGKLQPEVFPHVFGPNADEPLDADIVRQRFTELAEKIRAQTGDTRTPVEVAQGFLDIAVENMANAIKRISIQRGHDVSRYTLVSFGGAGGQHACLVADALGMQRVLIHPFAGVLSAYGMGLADVRALRERSVELPLAEGGLTEAERLAAELIEDAAAELAAQGIPRYRTYVRVHLKYQGTDTALAVPLADEASVVARFEAAYSQQFGFVMRGRALVVDAVSVERDGGGSDVVEPPPGPGREGSLTPLATVQASRAGQMRAAPLYDRDAMRPGDVVDGPAILRERTATTVVEPGWRAELNALGHLLLTRVQPLPRRKAAGTDVDPVLLEVFNNLFRSVAEQMGVALRNTSYSVNIKERLDFSCALFDAEGRLITNAPHVPVHLGSMGASVRSVIEHRRGTMRPGDVYMLNNPYGGGTHLPDVTVITPVFDEEGREVRCYVASRGHHADIGGITPGSMPPASSRIEEEGILIDDFQLVAGGEFQEQAMRALFGSGPYPARNIEQNLADLRAQIAANAKGVQELRNM